MEDQNGRPLDIVANQNSSVPHLPQTVEQVLDKTNGDDHQDSHIMNNFQRDEHLSK
jgi:HD-like signal output (HDOD) protein